MKKKGSEQMLERKRLLSILFHRAQVNLFQHDDKTITKNNWNSLNQCNQIYSEG